MQSCLTAWYWAALFVQRISCLVSGIRILPREVIIRGSVDVALTTPLQDQAFLQLAASPILALQGAAEMCEWMVQYGTDPQLLNISSAVYTSPTENQIYQSMPEVQACSLAPGAAPASLAAPRAKAADRVSPFPCTSCRMQSLLAGWYLTSPLRSASQQGNFYVFRLHIPGNTPNVACH